MLLLPQRLLGLTLLSRRLSGLTGTTMLFSVPPCASPLTNWRSLHEWCHPQTALLGACLTSAQQGLGDTLGLAAAVPGWRPFPGGVRNKHTPTFLHPTLRPGLALSDAPHMVTSELQPLSPLTNPAFSHIFLLTTKMDSWMPTLFTSFLFLLLCSNGPRFGPGKTLQVGACAS